MPVRPHSRRTGEQWAVPSRIVHINLYLSQFIVTITTRIVGAIAWGFFRHRIRPLFNDAACISIHVISGRADAHAFMTRAPIDGIHVLFVQVSNTGQTHFQLYPPPTPRWHGVSALGCPPPAPPPVTDPTNQLRVSTRLSRTCACNDVARPVLAGWLERPACGMRSSAPVVFDYFAVIACMHAPAHGECANQFQRVSVTDGCWSRAHRRRRRRCIDDIAVGVIIAIVMRSDPPPPQMYANVHLSVFMHMFGWPMAMSIGLLRLPSPSCWCASRPSQWDTIKTCN